MAVLTAIFSKSIHSNCLQAFKAADSKLMAIARQKKRTILKAKLYFDCKAQHEKTVNSGS